MAYPNVSPSGGRMYREDGSVINAADYIAPIPNGDETISVAAAGIKTLTPPNTGSLRADIVCPVDCWVRFGADPSINIGEKFAAGSKIKLQSAEEIAVARIYVTGACTLFAIYYK